MCVCVLLVVAQVDIFKDPVTDHGKLSKKGRVTLELDDGGQYITRTQGTGNAEKVALSIRVQCCSSLPLLLGYYDHCV